MPYAWIGKLSEISPVVGVFTSVGRVKSYPFCRWLPELNIKKTDHADMLRLLYKNVKESELLAIFYKPLSASSSNRIDHKTRLDSQIHEKLKEKKFKETHKIRLPNGKTIVIIRANRITYLGSINVSMDYCTIHL